MTTKQRQHLLAYLGYYVGNVDGDWGTLSKTACRAFQEDFQGIKVDGYGGPETDKALRHAVAYDMFRVADAVDKIPENSVPVDKETLTTGTFWDDIEFFTRDEFKCKCGQYHVPYCSGFPAEPKEAMVRIADQIRRHFGKPANVISGLRCPQHNADSDGAVNSQHMYGEACDICVEGISSAELLAYVKTLPGVRYAYAINATNVHFDIPKGAR